MLTSLLRARTALVNAARGLTKSYGERIRGCNPRNLDTEKVQALSPELQSALRPMLQALEALSERIVEYDQPVESARTCPLAPYRPLSSPVSLIPGIGGQNA